LGETRYVDYIRSFEAIFASHSNKGGREDGAGTEPKIIKKIALLRTQPVGDANIL
jgi:hypothetical protein